MTEALLGFVGDVVIDQAVPDSVFDHIRQELHGVDMLFGNQEAPYTDDPHTSPNAVFAVYAAPSNAAALGRAGFSMMSLANNHIVDAGHTAMLDTDRLIRDQGIATAGIGVDEADAHVPAYADAGPYRVAMLAYSSTFPPGYEARPGWPGLAPMRSETVWEAHGDRARVRTPIPQMRAVVWEEDASAMRRDFQVARTSADVVVASFHWGDVMQKFTVTDHERRVARMAIDAGADIVVGHHHHTLRGIEWYRGKPIFYGLGNFIFNFGPETIERISVVAGGLAHVSDSDDNDGNYGNIETHEGWPLLPFHKDTRLTMLAWCQISKGQPTAVGFLPCQARPDGSVKPFDPSSIEGQKVVEYVREACASEGFAVHLEQADDVRIGRYSTVRVVDVSEN